MPAPSCRMYPARSRNLWLATSASVGASRRVGMKSLDQRCIEMAWRAFPSANRTQRDEETSTILNRRRVGAGCAAQVTCLRTAGGGPSKILAARLEALSGMQLECASGEPQSCPLKLKRLCEEGRTQGVSG